MPGDEEVEGRRRQGGGMRAGRSDGRQVLDVVRLAEEGFGDDPGSGGRQAGRAGQRSVASSVKPRGKIYIILSMRPTMAKTVEQPIAKRMYSS